MKRATVWWADSHYNDSVQSFDQISRSHHPMILATTGWVVLHDRVGISLAFDNQEENPDLNPPDCRRVAFISRGTIQRIEWLEPPAKQPVP